VSIHEEDPPIERKQGSAWIQSISKEAFKNHVNDMENWSNVIDGIMEIGTVYHNRVSEFMGSEDIFDMFLFLGTGDGGGDIRKQEFDEKMVKFYDSFKSNIVTYEEVGETWSMDDGDYNIQTSINIGDDNKDEPTEHDMILYDMWMKEIGEDEEDDDFYTTTTTTTTDSDDSNDEEEDVSKRLISEINELTIELREREAEVALLKLKIEEKQDELGKMNFVGKRDSRHHPPIEKMRAAYHKARSAFMIELDNEVTKRVKLLLRGGEDGMMRARMRQNVRKRMQAEGQSLEFMSEKEWIAINYPQSS
jgi:hypothetical protein